MALLKINMQIVDISEGIKSWDKKNLRVVKRSADMTACEYAIHSLKSKKVFSPYLLHVYLNWRCHFFPLFSIMCVIPHRNFKRLSCLFTVDTDIFP